MGLFMEKGFEKAESVHEADIILFNTCSVRKHAEDRAISNMGKLLKIKNEKLKIKNINKKSKIYGIIGCTAQALKRDLFKRLPALDLVCGTGEIHKLPQLIENVAEDKVLAYDNIDIDIPEAGSHYRENKKTAYVSIMRGCNNFCSYCIVPFVRGRERSRKAEDIIGEVGDLAKRGFREVKLLGQNVNSYRNGACDFVQLLKRISNIDGVEKIKFMTSHPKDASMKLFEAMKNLDKVDKHLHLPVQSGSDRILKLMNRGYTAGKYTTLIKNLRRLIPGCRITTDVIVGFPTESDTDFKKTRNLMNNIKFNAAYIFKYSPRPPAKSSFLGDDVSKEVKRDRHKILLDLQKGISKKK